MFYINNNNKSVYDLFKFWHKRRFSHRRERKGDSPSILFSRSQFFSFWVRKIEQLWVQASVVFSYFTGNNRSIKLLVQGEQIHKREFLWFTEYFWFKCLMNISRNFSICQLNRLKINKSLLLLYVKFWCQNLNPF